jgi:hypothetical protein
VLVVVTPAELVTAGAVTAPAVVAGGTAAGASEETAEGSWVTARVVAADDCVRLLSACCVWGCTPCQHKQRYKRINAQRYSSTLKEQIT